MHCQVSGVFFHEKWKREGFLFACGAGAGAGLISLISQVTNQHESQDFKGIGYGSVTLACFFGNGKWKQAFLSSLIAGSLNLSHHISTN